MTDIATAPVGAATLERVVVGGDLSKLSSEEKLYYYRAVCESVGLNPLTRPFEYIYLSGKLTLYARRDATDQLRKLHGVSIYRLDAARLDDIYVVTAYARDAQGREDVSTGVVFLGGLRGVDLANGLMKAETKAKRRVTLSICGLGMLDETEVEDADAPAPGRTVVTPDSILGGAVTSETGVDPGAAHRPASDPSDTELALARSNIIATMDRLKLTGPDRAALIRDHAKANSLGTASLDGLRAVLDALKTLDDSRKAK